MVETNSTALIVGASRGLGLAMAEEYFSRGWQVVGTVRGEAHTGLHDLATASRGRVKVEQVDINDEPALDALRQRFTGRNFDLLFVNAGVANGRGDTVDGTTREDFVRVMVTNAFSPMRVIAKFEDLVPPSGTLGVMSSELGSVADNEAGGWEVYRGSKATLNTFMRSFAAGRRGDPRAMLVIAPGWVRTDMGGPNATLAISESIPAVVDVITASTGKPGLRYLNYLGKTIRW